MIQTFLLLLGQLTGCLRSRAELELENLVLRHQIEILRRTAPKRVRLVRGDRFVFTLLLRIWPRIAQSNQIVLSLLFILSAAGSLVFRGGVP